jgi:chromosome segregation ATPase
MKEITDLIEKLVKDKTFSLDAVKAVDELKQKFEAVERERDAHKAKLEEVDGKWQRDKSTLATRNEEITSLKSEVTALKAEQEKAKVAIYEAEMQRAVAYAYKDALYTVFKPNAVREVVQRSQPIVRSYPQGGDYVEWGSTTETTSKEG